MKNIFYLILVTLFVSCSRTYILLEDGENLSQLTQITDNGRPCLSPTGGANSRDLYFSIYEKGGALNIYYKPDPSSPAMIKKTSGKNINLSPSYCPTTKSVAFHCKNEGMFNSDIYSISANSESGLKQITDTPEANEGNPCISRDGRFVVYDKHPLSYITLSDVLCDWSAYRQAINSEIWMKNLRTNETTLLGKGYQPQISPDGKKLAYVKYSSDIQSCNIWIMDLRTGEMTKITDAKKGYAFFPRWSPDGKKIVFQLTRQDKKDADIYVVDANGNNTTQLTINKSYDGSPFWASDGTLYFVSDRGSKAGNYQIWRIKMDGYRSSLNPGYRNGLNPVSR